MKLIKNIKSPYFVFNIGIVLFCSIIFLYNFSNEKFFLGQTGYSFIFFVTGFIFSIFCNKNQNKIWSEKIILLLNGFFKYFLITFVIFSAFFVIFIFFGDFEYLNKVIKTFLSTFIGYSNFYLSKTHNFELQNVINPFYNSWAIALVIQSLFLLFLSEFLNNNKIISIIVNLILILLFFTSIIFFFQFDITYYWNYFNIYTRFHEFFLGFIYFRFLNNQKINQNLKKYLTLFLFCFSLFLIFYNLDFYSLTIFVICLAAMLCLSCYRFILDQNTKIYEHFYKLYLVHYPIFYYFTIYNNNKIKFYVIFFILIVSIYFFYLIFLKKEKFKKNYNNLFFKEINIKLIFILFITFILINYSKNINYDENRPKDFFKTLSKVNYLSNIYNNYNINSTSYKTYLFNQKKITNCLSLNVPNNFEKFYLENCFKKNNDKVLFYVVGDSHATMYAPLFDNLKNSDFLISAYDGGFYIPHMYKVDGALNSKTKSINKIKLNQTQNHFEKNIQLFKKISSKYEKSFFVIISNFVSHIENHDILDENFNTLETRPEIYKKINTNFSNFIKKINPTTEILIFEPVPTPTMTLSRCRIQIEIFGENQNYCDYNYNHFQNSFFESKKMLKNLDKKFQNVNIFSINKDICLNNKCSFFYDWKNKQAFITDASHITIQTNSVIKDEFTKFLNSIYANKY